MIKKFVKSFIRKKEDERENTLLVNHENNEDTIYGTIIAVCTNGDVFDTVNRCAMLYPDKIPGGILKTLLHLVGSVTIHEMNDNRYHTSMYYFRVKSIKEYNDYIKIDFYGQNNSIRTIMAYAPSDNPDTYLLVMIQGRSYKLYFLDN